MLLSKKNREAFFHRKTEDILPCFYIKDYDPKESGVVLDEDNSRHAIQVLRMKNGDSVHLTDGKGYLLTAVITNDHKKRCEVRVSQAVLKPRTGPEVTIAIAPTKNNSRFEWFLEKAAELGVSRVIPIVTKRTEKQNIKATRVENILISAMLQSRQTWLVETCEPMLFDALMRNDVYTAIQHKYIAHCIEGNKEVLKYTTASSIILIGPEGDFTLQEVEEALSKGYRPVTLGDTRLRTETAGMAAAALLRIPQ